MSDKANPKIEIRNPKLDIDELLRSFFRSEMPQPWPAFAKSKIEDRESRIEKLEVDVIPQSSTRHFPSSILHPRPSMRSRLVLAASIALLLISSWWLSQRLTTAESTYGPGSSGKMIGSKPKSQKHTSPRPSPVLPVR
jgi:hypothetical protein